MGETGPLQPLLFGLLDALHEVGLPVIVGVRVTLPPPSDTAVGLALRVTVGGTSHELLVVFHNVPETQLAVAVLDLRIVPPAVVPGLGKLSRLNFVSG